VAPPTKSNQSGSPPVLLARRRLQIGEKDQIPKMNGIGPSTMTVSARKQRWIFQIPLLHPDSTKMFYGTAGVTVRQYLNNCREETDWFLSYIFQNCGIILYASNPQYLSNQPTCKPRFFILWKSSQIMFRSEGSNLSKSRKHTFCLMFSQIVVWLERSN
jgi:hypothetical protein